MSLFEGTQTDKQTDRERGRKWLDIQRQTDDRVRQTDDKVFFRWFDRLTDKTFLYIKTQTDDRVLFYWFDRLKENIRERDRQAEGEREAGTVEVLHYFTKK